MCCVSSSRLYQYDCGSLHRVSEYGNVVLSGPNRPFSMRPLHAAPIGSCFPPFSTIGCCCGSGACSVAICFLTAGSSRPTCACLSQGKPADGGCGKRCITARTAWCGRAPCLRPLDVCLNNTVPNSGQAGSNALRAPQPTRRRRLRISPPVASVAWLCALDAFRPRRLRIPPPKPQTAVGGSPRRLRVYKYKIFYI